MVELISRISKGTRMDQIYIPKERIPGFELGATVMIKPVLEKAKPKPYYFKVTNLEPIKNIVIEEILNYFEQLENVLITGSFLEKGFGFGDIDVLLITNGKIGNDNIESHFEREFGIKFHITTIAFKSLLKGLSTDPLFQMMLSKFVSGKRVIFRVINDINCKLLDLHLLKYLPLLYNTLNHKKYLLIKFLCHNQ